ncbi:hypothetical protein N7462_008567 [Penicillium macrosclerotiorum]|uniref:uncharacterized protein n=1 Tax=Penicillium macrosclerotiorum TaxID=303699 RepID=UPI002547EE34|nr:uncharacterized protein N7462_008567 [Penicillium macrosclerotiorum]KAJ5675670.1 hypothetical protein N7462_008567 [Penicillium macrosclerotiorum]
MPEKSQKQVGWIWPKDPRPGNPSHWPRRWRWVDILTGRGPDMYVGTIGKPPRTKEKQPSKTNWARWDEELDSKNTPFVWARCHGQRYDFRQRKYVVPDSGSWSMVQYCDGQQETDKRRLLHRKKVHFVPRSYLDVSGKEVDLNSWHDEAHGAHRDREDKY